MIDHISWRSYAHCSHSLRCIVHSNLETRGRCDRRCLGLLMFLGFSSQAAGHNVALRHLSTARQRPVPALGNSRPAYNHRLLTLRLGSLRLASTTHAAFSR